MIGELIRNKVFWIYDALKNSGEIKKHYNDIKSKMKNSNSDFEKQLEALLLHANNTTSFYKNIKSKKINEYPIVTKRNFADNFNEFLSDEFANQELHKMSTSGSTGTPFTVYQNRNKRNRTLADIIYFNEICGQNLGDKYIFFRVWTDKNKKSAFERFKQNLVPIDILRLDDESLENIRDLLKKDSSINSALAYGSTYEHLVNYLSNCGDTPEMFNIKLFVTSSEVLDYKVKRRIKDVIGCKIIDRYSNQENGIIAQTGDLSEEFLVNTASYYVELLKLDSDEEADEGELGRIVITDLYNYALPMIRYDTGDLAIHCGKSDNGQIVKFKSVQGRRVDTFYDTKGNRITAHAWSVHMWKFDKLKQYQFIQEGQNSYVLKVSGGKGIYSEEEFVRTLCNVLGEDANIKIEFVDSIPVLSSGKFKKTICNYTPSN